MARSKNGSVRRLKSGRFQARYMLPTGKQASAGTFETRSQARQRLDEIQVDIRRGEHWDGRKGKTRFRDFMVEYMAHRELTATQGELANNRSYLKVHLLPAFGNLRMEELDEEAVDKWFAAQRPTETRRNVYAFLRRAMKYAVKWKYVRRSPCQVLDLNKSVGEPRPSWSKDDFLRVLEHVPTEVIVNNASGATRVYYREALEVMFAAHLRLGEVVALNANDFNRKTGELRIERQVTNLGHTTETKTGARAELYLFEIGVAAINRLPLGIGAVPMFPGVVSPRMPRSSLQKAWRSAARKAGLENFHVHDIRHIGLTLVAASGAPIKDVMARGRHRSLQSAIRYQHTDADRDRKVADDVNRLMGGSWGASATSG